MFAGNAGCGVGGYVPPIASTGGVVSTATVYVQAVPGGATISVNGEDRGSPAIIHVPLGDGLRVMEDVEIVVRWDSSGREATFTLRAGDSQPPPILKINSNGAQEY